MKQNNDALARVKAVIDAATEDDIWRAHLRWMDIDDIVHEVEAARAFGGAYDEWLGIFRDMIKRESKDRALDLVMAKDRLGVARELLDAVRKKDPIVSEQH